MTHRFFCPCEPPKATAQQKGVYVSGGKPNYYTKGHVKRAKALFASLFLNRRPPCPFNGPLRVEVVLTFPWHKDATKAQRARGWMPMPVRPDWDNLAKVPFDVLSDLSFWCDDGQVYDGRLIKGWGSRPGVRVTISEVDEFMSFGCYIGEGI